MSDPKELFQLETIRPWLESNGFYSRDWGLLSAALERPWAQFAGQDLYVDVWQKTAALISSVESNHPLIDGNKRLGVLLGALMLRIHGINDDAINDDAWYELILDIAENHPSVEVIASRLRRAADE